MTADTPDSATGAVVVGAGVVLVGSSVVAVGMVLELVDELVVVGAVDDPHAARTIDATAIPADVRPIRERNERACFWLAPMDVMVPIIAPRLALAKDPPREVVHALRLTAPGRLVGLTGDRGRGRTGTVRRSCYSVRSNPRLALVRGHLGQGSGVT
jgi:hypothetical protein